MDKTTTFVCSEIWTQEDKDGKMTRKQIPLILAFAITIHKCQGCTLDFAVCDLGPSVFEDGQAYVALSRVRSKEGLLVLDYYPPSIKTNQKALAYVKTMEDTQQDSIIKSDTEEVDDNDENNNNKDSSEEVIEFELNFIEDEPDYGRCGGCLCLVYIGNDEGNYKCSDCETFYCQSCFFKKTKLVDDVIETYVCLDCFKSGNYEEILEGEEDDD
jgi:hypothetical protein